jgi:hypothetical protein
VLGLTPEPSRNSATRIAVMWRSSASPCCRRNERIYDDLAKLDPPRKHHQKYFATREANENVWHAPQGVHDLLRAYYHRKSADWKENDPFPLKARTASEWAKLPRYYVMDLAKGMAETVAPAMPSSAVIAACKWLPEDELRVYSAEYERTGFQGAHSSLLERAIGASSRVPATSRKCRRRRAGAWWARIF